MSHYSLITPFRYPLDALASTYKQGPFEEPDALAFPFMRLPAEIREEVYHYLMLSGCSFFNVMPHPFRFEHKTEITDPIHSSLLRTSRQIYQEAYAVLYGENEFMFCLSGYEDFDAEGHPDNLLGFPMRNLRLIRLLSIYFDVSPGYRTIENVCTFMKRLASVCRSLKKIEIRYEFPHFTTKNFDTHTNSFRLNHKLLDAICAVHVQSKISLVFASYRFVHGLPQLCTQYAEEIADKKSWIIKEVYTAFEEQSEAVTTWFATEYEIYPRAV